MSKKAEISNQTLGMLLVVAITLSLIGTFISVTKVGQVPTIRLVGYAIEQNTSTAIVNLTVDQVLDINFTLANVDWGEGSVTPGAINCTMTTDGTFGDGAANCTGFSGTQNPPGIENIGNQNVTLNISFSSNATTMIGGTNPKLEFIWDCEVASSCLNMSGDNVCTTMTDDNIGNETWLPSQWYEVNETATNAYTLCPNFNYMEASDMIAVGFFVVVPEDSHTGNLSTTITATAYVIDCQLAGTC